MEIKLDKDIILLDLFSGIGGFAKGLQDAGFNIKKHYFSEIYKQAIANYKRNFKNSEYVGPIENVYKRKLKPNIITFGSPCQDFSLAGKRKGLKGQRSSLITQAIEIITKEKPELFIWENVKGTFSSNTGADFWAIIQAFANIGCYRLEWQLLNTSWVLPQNRERLYLVGHLTTPGRSFKPIFPITKSNEWIISKRFCNESQTQNNSTTIGTKPNRQCCTYINSKYYGNHQQDRVYKTDGLMACLTSKRTDDKIKIFSNTNKGFDNASVGDSINVSPVNSKTRRGRVGMQKANTLDTQSVQAVITPDRKIKRQHGRRFKDDGEPAFTINTQDQHGVLINNKSIRRLTEIECERLQGFPDDWTRYGLFDSDEGLIEKVIPKTHRYHMIGNAVTKDIVEVIGRILIDNYY